MGFSISDYITVCLQNDKVTRKPLSNITYGQCHSYFSSLKTHLFQIRKAIEGIQVISERQRCRT